MFDPDHAAAVNGSHLLRLIDEVRRAFIARPACECFENGFRQVNSVRVVTLEVHEELSTEAQIAVIVDLVRQNHNLVIRRTADLLFEASDSPASHITDVVCEVVWQTLMDDPAIRMMDEDREALAGY